MEPQAKEATLAERAAEAAATLLERRGYRIVERDWKCDEGGFDVVASRDGTLVLAQVAVREGRGGRLPRRRRPQAEGGAGLCRAALPGGARHGGRGRSHRGHRGARAGRAARAHPPMARRAGRPHGPGGERRRRGPMTAARRFEKG